MEVAEVLSCNKSVRCTETTAYHNIGREFQMSLSKSRTRVVIVVTIAIVDFVVYAFIGHVAFTTPTAVSRRHCEYVKTAKRNHLPSPKTPPWFSNTTIRSGEVLYLWAKDSNTRRFGNRLFTYASTYGIAWRTGHIPILLDPGNESKKYDLARLFNIRMPVDHGNWISQVRCYNILEYPATRYKPVINNEPEFSSRLNRTSPRCRPDPIPGSTQPDPGSPQPGGQS